MSDSLPFAVDFFKNCKGGFDRLSTEAQRYLRDAVIHSLAANGFFSGRGEQGDLYYTFFGLLLAVVTNAKVKFKICEDALAAVDFKKLDLVHAGIWLRINNLLKLSTLPASLRGKAVEFLSTKADRAVIEKVRQLASLSPSAFPHSDPFSPYSRFLLGTLYADFGLEIPEIDLEPYRLSSGLYSNLRNSDDYGVNATASALFLISGEKREKTVKALLELQQPDGSFKAAENAPCGDLLSTGTTVFALKHCGMKPHDSIKAFLRECFRENGLFAATPEDPIGDVEYSVYALLALGGSP
jgi:hypothetical protein